MREQIAIAPRRHQTVGRLSYFHLPQALAGLLLACDQVDYCQHDDRANEGYQQAGQVKTGDTRTTKQAEHPPPHRCSYDTREDIGDASHPVIALGDDAGQPAGNAA